jgi:hypothetical protein
MDLGYLAEAIETGCRREQLLWHSCAGPAPCHGPAGFADVVIIGRGGVLLVRLEPDDPGPGLPVPDWGNVVSHWLFENPVVQWVTWSPADLASGHIDAELERLRFGRPGRKPRKRRGTP